ncbi:non-hydrolyzing UDP-N-acetylglucosamine 2-epimerase [Roseomonas sp. CCTCC AB2023176]|uniref:non-hydrolyzing UDP-N-acetylglucosamine 2-epimerase n=1 Tax=Roseomonas sp. CCTCC AB2023176 TaxID=3342640 RepID=UPI0035DF29C3
MLANAEADGADGTPARIMVVFGTRPEAIKMMPVLRELRARPGLHPVAVATGQHRSMLDGVLATFGMGAPDHDLDVMQSAQTLASLTGRVLAGMTDLLLRERPDLVLVHGDTTTALAAGLAAFYARIPVGHVEAGLRSSDLDRPWPEELNRVAVDAFAALRFAPTKAAAANLAGEYGSGRVLVTGNTGIDALLHTAARLDADAALEAGLAARYAFLHPGRRLVLVTGHRRESFGEGFARICTGLARIAARGDVDVLYPVHLNPQVQGIVRERLSGQPNVHLIDPVEYLDMVWLLRRAAVIVTDSGGIQEEAPALGKPVLVLREVTERPEALETGVVRLVGTDPDVLARAADALLDDPAFYARVARPVFPYGDGTAARRIADCLEERFAMAGARA